MKIKGVKSPLSKLGDRVTAVFSKGYGKISAVSEDLLKDRGDEVKSPCFRNK